MSFPSIYTTRASLESAGVPTQTWDAARLNEALAQVGSSIDQITAGRFIASEETFYVSGDERSVIFRPDFLPILAVSNIDVEWNATNRRGMVFSGVLGDVSMPKPYAFPTNVTLLSSSYSFPTGTYKLKYFPTPRIIESIRGVFPGGVQNIAVTGVCGWVEPSSIKAEAFITTTTTDITETSTTVTLTSVVGLKNRDVMIVGDLALIAQSIAGNVVTIDPPAGLITGTIASGTAVAAYGAVPRGIQRVANFFMMQEVQRQEQWAQGNFIDSEGIASETTDKYSYKRFTPIQQVAAGKSPGMTGVAVIDQILMDYTCLPVINFA